jgi:hypothetical protein
VQNSPGWLALLKGALGLEGTPPKAQPEMGAAIQLKKWEAELMESCTCGKCQRVCEEYFAHGITMQNVSNYLKQGITMQKMKLEYCT